MPDENLNWRDALPDGIKANESLASFKDVSALAKSFIDTKAYQGNSISIPGEDAGDDQRQQFVNKLLDKVPGVMMRPNLDNEDQSRDFYRTLGMPEKAEGYDLPEVELPEGQAVNEDKISFFRDLAHKTGLTKSQFTIFLKAITEADALDFTAAKTSQDEQTATLKKDWGMATEERTADTLSIAERTKAPESFIKSIKDGQVSAEMMKWVHSLSVSIGSEGNNIGDAPASSNGKMTPSEAKEKIDEIYKNRDHAFHKGDRDAMKRMIELVGAANPASSRDINTLRAGASFGG